MKQSLLVSKEGALSVCVCIDSDLQFSLAFVSLCNPCPMVGRSGRPTSDQLCEWPALHPEDSIWNCDIPDRRTGGVRHWTWVILLKLCMVQSHFSSACILTARWWNGRQSLNTYRPTCHIYIPAFWVKHSCNIFHSWKFISVYQECAV